MGDRASGRLVSSGRLAGCVMVLETTTTRVLHHFDRGAAWRHVLN